MFSNRTVLRFMSLTYSNSMSLRLSGLRRNRSSVHPAPRMSTFFPFSMKYLWPLSVKESEILRIPKSTLSLSDTFPFMMKLACMLYISGVPRLWHHQSRGFLTCSSLAWSGVMRIVFSSFAARVTSRVMVFPSKSIFSLPWTGLPDMFLRVVSAVSHAWERVSVSTSVFTAV